MTAKAALAKAFLEGKVLNIKNCFELIGLTNCPREVSRMIEKPFGVTINRVHREGKSRYGQPCVWVDYFLTPNGCNEDGVKKMIEYVQKNGGVIKQHSPKQKKEKVQQDISQNPLFS